MPSLVSPKVLLALVVCCVALGLEGFSSASKIQRRQDVETSEEDLGEEGQNNLRLANGVSEEKYATFVNADRHSCGTDGELNYSPVLNERDCYERPQELHHSHFCLKPLPNCLQVKVYPLRSCGGRPSVTYPNSRLSEPFTFKSFKVIEIDNCPLPLGRERWFQLRELQENRPESSVYN